MVLQQLSRMQKSLMSIKKQVMNDELESKLAAEIDILNDIKEELREAMEKLK